MWIPLQFNETISPVVANAAVSVLSVDPWSSGDGSLSFPNAIDALAGQLADNAHLCGLGFAVSGSTMAGFMGQLSALNSAFPLPSLQRVFNLATQMQSLESTMMQLVPHQLHGAGLLLNSLPAMRALTRSSLISAATDAAADYLGSLPFDNLTAFEDVKAEFEQGLADLQESALGGLVGGAGMLFFSEGNLLSALKNNMPGHDHAFTAINLMIGSPAAIAPLRGIFS